MAQRRTTNEHTLVAAYMAFVFFSNFSTILYFLTTYLLQTGYSLESISLFLVAYQGSKLLLEVPTGFIADHFGRKQSGLFGLAALAIYYAVLLAKPTNAFMCFAFLLKGFSVACVSGSFESLYLDAIPEKKLIRYNTVERVLFYCSYAISAILGGVIAANAAFKLGLLLDISAVLLAGICGLFLPDKQSERVTALTNNHFKSLWKPSGNKILILLYLMDVSQAFAYVSIEDFFAPLLHQVGLSSETTGAVLAIQLLVSSIAGLFVPKLLDRVQKPLLYKSTAIGRIVATALFLCPYFLPLTRAIFYTIQVTLYVLFAPIKYELFQQCSNPSHRCTLISIQSLSVSLGAMAFYTMSAILSSHIQLNDLLLLALAIMALVYVPCLITTARAISK